MKRILYFLPLLCVAFAMCASDNPKKSDKNPSEGEGSQTVVNNGDPDINVMSFNIRYDNSGDNENQWKYRRDRVANAIKFYDVDLLGAQEVLHGQLTDLQSRLPEYKSLGVGREDGKTEGEYSAIFYRKDRFTPTQSGCFWLSETPEVAGSKGWDGACERIATWAVFYDNVNGRELFMLDTHLDHVGTQARKEGVKLLLTKIKELAGGRPIVVTGDFNAGVEDQPVKDMLAGGMKDARAVSPLVYGPDWTWHDWQGYDYPWKSRIDFVFVKDGFDVRRYGILAETENGRYLSDHCPVLTTLTFN